MNFYAAGMRFTWHRSLLRTFFLFTFVLCIALSQGSEDAPSRPNLTPTQKEHPKLDFSDKSNDQKLLLAKYPPLASDHQPQLQIKAAVEDKLRSGQLVKVDDKRDYIFLNTIDGHLYAVGKHDGVIKWNLKEEAVLKFPKNYNKPHFLTDPRDGSLYIFTNQNEGLKKFPYTIAELVSASPARTKDGYLYTGDKHDQWLAIDYTTGAKLDTLTSDSLHGQVAADASDNVVYIGRTKYTIGMFDIATSKRVFNLTFYDYSTHATKSTASGGPAAGRRPVYDKPRTPNLHDEDEMLRQHLDSSLTYPYYHFSSSSDGTLLTMDRLTGEVRWRLKLDHPVVAMYQYVGDHLHKINFAIYAVEALAGDDSHKLLYTEQRRTELLAIMPGQQVPPSAGTRVPPPPGLGHDLTVRAFTPSLYIGYYRNTLYALPAYVYNTHDLKLLDGPPPLVPYPANPNETSGLEAEDGGGKSPLDEGGDETTTASFPLNASVGYVAMPERFDEPRDYIESNKYRDIFRQTPELCLPEDNPPPKKPKSTPGGLLGVYRTVEYYLADHRLVSILLTVVLCSLFPLYMWLKERARKRRRQLKKQQQLAADEESSSRRSASRHSDHTVQRRDSALSSSSDEDDEVTRRKAIKFQLVDTDRDSTTRSNELRNATVAAAAAAASGALAVTASGNFAIPEYDANGAIRIGKISYDPASVLGHGCAGTFVYKGTFENRPVAVKRLLPQCYTLADREVELLRDADQHANVLRYFCTESDAQFRYIALELCQMTLYDFVNKKEPAGSINLTEYRNATSYLSVLEQATCGLSHLHKLDIVHRDIKPANILLNFIAHEQRIVALISDFGLCKRLEIGNNSFSKRSGITGTDGWIAPELVLEDDVNTLAGDESGGGGDNNEEILLKVQRRRVTKAVDIFSMGCVYYFVLSEGNHAFGDAIRRQANILSNEFKLDKLVAKLLYESFVQKVIIEKMISHDSANRPTSKEILAHPIFWSKAKVLQFLQDVSDRIEKIEPDDPIVLELEKSANVTLKNNWKSHICPQLQNDLKKFRTYNGVSVRDLLRAIRNKKHHYRELPPEVKQSLGSLPDEFVHYFTYRFPKLLIHVYEAMKICSNEPMINAYYEK